LVEDEAAVYDAMAAGSLGKLIAKMEKQMFDHAKNLEFEEAAALRDKIDAIKRSRFGVIEDKLKKA
ncbi:MAG: UvrB/UvrC motif-containing protein, partial [Acidiferrobacterales bacterium]|nr:UvrB/UvrC motif-containing protein [Acidiferrobacterales bacterium]